MTCSPDVDGATTAEDADVDPTKATVGIRPRGGLIDTFTYESDRSVGYRMAVGVEHIAVEVERWIARDERKHEHDAED